jgi:mRNA interferase RelE/StbE
VCMNSKALAKSSVKGHVADRDHGSDIIAIYLLIYFILEILSLMKMIIFTQRSATELDDLPEPGRTIVSNALNRYAIEGRGDVKKLKDRDGYRLRIGDYRVIFAEDAQTILAIFVGRRTTTTY